MRGFDRGIALPAAAMLLAAAYMYVFADRGWIPFDDGNLGHSAERVLDGELPHVDFNDVYTGGLSFLNALALQLFGERLLSLRWPLYGLFLLHLPCLWYVLTRFLPARQAPVWFGLAVVWGWPNYSTPMPSWYNLFLTVMGIAALVRYVDVGRRRWILMAGLCAGLSIIAKTTGLYFVAATFFFLIHREGLRRRALADSGSRFFTVYRTFVMVGMGAFLLLLIRLLRQFPSPEAYYHFLLPSLGVVLAVSWIEFGRSKTGQRSGASLGALVGEGMPFVVGAAVPVLALAVPYVSQGRIDNLVQGVLLLPRLRFEFATRMPPPLWGIWVTLFVASSLMLISRARSSVQWGLCLLGLLVCLVIWWVDPSDRVPLWFWATMRPVIPLTVAAGLVTVVHSTLDDTDDAANQRRAILIYSLAVTSLVQFPYATSIYFLYVAPLLALALPAVLNRFGLVGAPVTHVASAFLLLMGIWSNVTGFRNPASSYEIMDYAAAPLPSARAGIRTSPETAVQYARLLELIETHGVGEYIWAGPDSPEVYFLSDKRNPTRLSFDFFGEPDGRYEDLVARLRSHDVNTIVVKTSSWFSPLPNPTILAALAQSFPNVRRLEEFDVRWRD